MDLYARVNILGGRAVRLPHGSLDEAVALDDPVNRAKGWVQKGANRLHITDLDAAAYGDYRNRDLIARIIDAVDVPVQVGGGVRTEREIERLLGMGAWRVVIGTLAVKDQVAFWDLNRKHPHKIVVALDVTADLEVAVQGWTEHSGVYLEETLLNLSAGGAAAFMIQEVGRDALDEPPNFEALETALRVCDQPVIAAGGVRDLEDVRTLIGLGSDHHRIAGMIVGREVTEGRFTIEELMAAIAGTEHHGPWTLADLDAALADYRKTASAQSSEATQEFLAWLITRSND